MLNNDFKTAKIQVFVDRLAYIDRMNFLVLILLFKTVLHDKVAFANHPVVEYYFQTVISNHFKMHC